MRTDMTNERCEFNRRLAVLQRRLERRRCAELRSINGSPVRILYILITIEVGQINFETHF
jgi:hypothetical protein